MDTTTLCKNWYFFCKLLDYNALIHHFKKILTAVRSIYCDYITYALKLAIYADIGNTYVKGLGQRGSHANGLWRVMRQICDLLYWAMLIKLDLTIVVRKTFLACLYSFGFEDFSPLYKADIRMYFGQIRWIHCSFVEDLQILRLMGFTSSREGFKIPQYYHVSFLTCIPSLYAFSMIKIV